MITLPVCHQLILIAHDNYLVCRLSKMTPKLKIGITTSRKAIVAFQTVQATLDSCQNVYERE
jgi:hypothetical protein